VNNMRSETIVRDPHQSIVILVNDLPRQTLGLVNAAMVVTSSDSTEAAQKY